VSGAGASRRILVRQTALICLPSRIHRNDAPISIHPIQNGEINARVFHGFNNSIFSFSKQLLISIIYQ